MEDAKPESLNSKEDYICLLAENNGFCVSFQNHNKVTSFIVTGVLLHMSFNCSLFIAFIDTVPFSYT